MLHNVTPNQFTERFTIYCMLGWQISQEHVFLLNFIFWNLSRTGFVIKLSLSGIKVNINKKITVLLQPLDRVLTSSTGAWSIVQVMQADYAGTACIDLTITTTSHTSSASLQIGLFYCFDYCAYTPCTDLGQEEHTNGSEVKVSNAGEYGGNSSRLFVMWWGVSPDIQTVMLSCCRE